MTGTRIFNWRLWLGLVGGVVVGGRLTADELALDGGARLTGTVRSIDAGGVVELASDLAPQPVLLKRGSVEKIAFSAQGAAPIPPAALLELTNGDQLPVTIEALDARVLTVVSPDAGRLEIARDCLKSLQLGIRQRKVAYAGPHSLDEWTSAPGEPKNWIFERNSLIANGPATAAKNLSLPPHFSLSLTLKWQDRQLPNFQVFFADPLKAKGELCDRYYLQFGGAGLEIKREASTGKRYNTLVQLNRNPTQYPDHQLQVELRVDRKAARLQLLLNGELEGEYGDPIPAVPEGSGVTLVCNTQNGNTQEISAMTVLELDDSRDRHRAEERGDPKTDSLISRDDDRWGGSLAEIRKVAGGEVFCFKSGFHKDLLEIPAADVSTVFFAASQPRPADAQPQPFVLRLRGDGALRVTSCQFSADALSAVHPLLGPLTVRREGIVAMERADSKPKTAPEP